MKKLLLILILISARAFAQDTLHIPASAAKAITRDLARCDSLRDVHKLTVEQLSLTERKVEVLDTMLTQYEVKCSMYREMLKNEESKFEVQGRWVGDLQNSIKILNRKLVATKIGFGAVILGLTYILVKSRL